MPARRRLLAAAVTAAACLGAQALSYATATAADTTESGAFATETVVSRGVEIPAFYTPPATIPAANGTLVRTEPFLWTERE